MIERIPECTQLAYAAWLGLGLGGTAFFSIFAFILAFTGQRTIHRLQCQLEQPHQLGSQVQPPCSACGCQVDHCAIGNPTTMPTEAEGLHQ